MSVCVLLCKCHIYLLKIVQTHVKLNVEFGCVCESVSPVYAPKTIRHSKIHAHMRVLDLYTECVYFLEKILLSKSEREGFLLGS